MSQTVRFAAKGRSSEFTAEEDRTEETMASREASPSYPSASRLSDSLCYPQYTASLKCLEEFNSDKGKCQEQFDIYKECKKKEREARLERNRKKSFFS
ncbi:PREDICTED: cytochrome c oxidase-assembly factor COX23, mitochondrial [Nelumbo nucifera]|uniref:Cytochrome c oxidase-assembly factor COX23, mitochondrial n=1 Tax=Nelumbo nucifera TaxID=4432 RepID=A0A1U8B2I6_NELNU|nr:PREDICTED: cytochrome c oxidase-assembly factor COX23, mitochondrial [Nelumbo nucifera]